MFMCTLSKKIRSKIAKTKKLVTRTPVSTKRTNRVASKNHTSGRDKKIFLSNLISRGLRGKHTGKSDQNSKKNFSVLAGLRSNAATKKNSHLQEGDLKMADSLKRLAVVHRTSRRNVIFEKNIAKSYKLQIRQCIVKGTK